MNEFNMFLTFSLFSMLGYRGDNQWLLGGNTADINLAVAWT